MTCDIAQEQYVAVIEEGVACGACFPTPYDIRFVLDHILKGRITYGQAAEKALQIIHHGHTHNAYCVLVWKTIIQVVYRNKSKGWLEEYERLFKEMIDAD